MSDDRDEPSSEDRGAMPTDPESASVGETPPPAAPASLRPPGPSAARRRAAPALAALLIFIIVMIGVVALSPFWAPAVTPLLPWGGKPASVAEAPARRTVQMTAPEERPNPLAERLDAVKSAQTALAQRIDRLEAAVEGLRRDQGAAAATKTALAQMAQRVDAAEAQSAARAATEAADIRTMQQEQSRLGGLTADLRGRVAQLERQAREQ